MTKLSLLLGSIDPFLLWFQPVHGRDVFMPGVKIILEIHLFLGAFLNLTFLLNVPASPISVVFPSKCAAGISRGDVSFGYVCGSLIKVLWVPWRPACVSLCAWLRRKGNLGADRGRTVELLPPVTCGHLYLVRSSLCQVLHRCE